MSLFFVTVLVAYVILDGSLPRGSAFLQTHLISGDSLPFEAWNSST
jgi:hypothetical protein